MAPPCVWFVRCWVVLSQTGEAADLLHLQQQRGCLQRVHGNAAFCGSCSVLVRNLSWQHVPTPVAAVVG